MRSSPGVQSFPHLPDSARLWVFGVGRELSPDEEARLLGRVTAFLEGWKAHGRALSAAHDWIYGRFLLVAVDDRVAPPSGCSIDALVGSLQALEAELSTEIVSGAPIWYRPEPDGVEIERLSRAAFRMRAEEGRVSGDTVVFDLSVDRVGALRQGRWELPARESWHRRYLDRSTASAPNTAHR